MLTISNTGYTISNLFVVTVTKMALTNKYMLVQAIYLTVSPSLFTMLGTTYTIVATAQGNKHLCVCFHSSDKRHLHSFKIYPLSHRRDVSFALVYSFTNKTRPLLFFNWQITVQWIEYSLNSIIILDIFYCKKLCIYPAIAT